MPFSHWLKGNQQRLLPFFVFGAKDRSLDEMRALDVLHGWGDLHGLEALGGPESGGPPLEIVPSSVETVFLIQDPVTVLGVLYCGFVFAPPPGRKLEDDWPESIFPQALIQPRRHLCYIAAASVSARGDAQCVWSHESSISSSYFPLELRRAISHESGLRKVHSHSSGSTCAEQLAQSHLRRATCAEQLAQSNCTKHLRRATCTDKLAQSTRAKRLHRATCSEHLRRLKSCDFPAGAAGVRSAYYVAIFKPELRGCAPRTTFVLKSCDFPA